MGAPSPSPAAPLQLLRWRARTQVFVERTGGLELPMVRIPAGRFWMGSPEGEEERSEREGPQQEVQLGEFLMGRTPITQEQWRTVAQWEPREGERWERELNLNPSLFQHPGEARLLNNEVSTDARPVEHVRWDDAREFCSRLSQRTGRTYTLPSEAQWEYACRAGTTTPFAFGETITPELANYGTYTYDQGRKGEVRQQTTPVGMFPANAWGLQDLHGNVWEWCLDQWHETFEGAPEDGSTWLSEGEERRLLRGGSWIFNPQELPLGLPQPRPARHRQRLHRVPCGVPPPGPFSQPLIPQSLNTWLFLNPWLLGCGCWFCALAPQAPRFQSL